MMCANLLDLRDKGDPCMKLENFKGVDFCALNIVRLPLSHQNVLALKVKPSFKNCISNRKFHRITSFDKPTLGFQIFSFHTLR